ncbi:MULTISPECIES: hypothetical protein [unclassified Mesorhizobium]|uniref:hypothetical protein n=1 Tax=unclassified Mesorhizobium TaxID=325217 RepID=UPI0030150698
MDRRAFLTITAISPLAIRTAHADDSVTYRVVGEVVPTNFDALWDLAARSNNQVVELKISCREQESEYFFAMATHGTLGIVSIQGKVRRALGFPAGFNISSHKFYVNGFYRVEREDAQMIGLIPVSKADFQATGKPVKQVEINKLAQMKN